jgi:hypothetical protein
MATTISRAAPAACGECSALSKRALLAQHAASEAGVAIYPKRIVRIFRQQGARLFVILFA